MERNYKFDNIKVFLMLLVIIAHSMDNSYGDKGQEQIRFLCLSYAMPLFTFISGYFSKPQISASKLLKSLLWPCILMSVVNYTLQALVVKDYTFSLWKPAFATWYLWALLAFRFLLPYLCRIPHILPISFVVSWLAGFIPFVGTTLCISRIVCFLPFFLLGYYVCSQGNYRFVKEYLFKLTNGGGWMLLLCFLMMFGMILGVIKPSVTYRTAFNSPYHPDYQFVEMLIRIMFQAIDIVGALCVIKLFPSHRTWYSQYALRTMNVYMLHALVVLPMAHVVFPPMDECSLFQKFLLIGVPVVVCLFLFSDFINRLMNYVMGK